MSQQGQITRLWLKSGTRIGGAFFGLASALLHLLQLARLSYYQCYSGLVILCPVLSRPSSYGLPNSTTDNSGLRLRVQASHPPNMLGTEAGYPQDGHLTRATDVCERPRRDRCTGSKDAPCVAALPRHTCPRLMIYYDTRD